MVVAACDIIQQVQIVVVVVVNGVVGVHDTNGTKFCCCCLL